MVLEFLADGFEEIEALCPLDLLRRAGVRIVTVSLRDDGAALGAHGINVRADMSAAEAESRFMEADIDMIILPGGMPGASNLDESETVDRFIKKVSGSDGYLAAICAAPMVLGRRGLLEGKRATCFPGFESELIGAQYTKTRVETDGRIVTSCGMGAAEEFGLELVRILKGDDAAESLRRAVFAR